MAFQCDIASTSGIATIQLKYSDQVLTVLGEKKTIDLSGGGSSEADSSDELKHVIVDGINLSTGRFKQTAYVGNPYLVKVSARGVDFKRPVELYADELQISVTSDKIQKVSVSSTNESSFSFTQEVALECYLSDLGTPCGDEYSENKASKHNN